MDFVLFVDWGNHTKYPVNININQTYQDELFNIILDIIINIISFLNLFIPIKLRFFINRAIREPNLKIKHSLQYQTTRMIIKKKKAIRRGKRINCGNATHKEACKRNVEKERGEVGGGGGVKSKWRGWKALEAVIRFARGEKRLVGCASFSSSLTGRIIEINFRAPEAVRWHCSISISKYRKKVSLPSFNAVVNQSIESFRYVFP